MTPQPLLRLHIRAFVSMYVLHKIRMGFSCTMNDLVQGGRLAEYSMKEYFDCHTSEKKKDNKLKSLIEILYQFGLIQQEYTLLFTKNRPPAERQSPSS